LHTFEGQTYDGKMHNGLFWQYEEWQNRCSISHDDRLVVTVANKNALNIWEVSSGTLVHTLRGHTDKTCSCYFSKDDSFILSTSVDATVRIWNTRTATLVKTLTDSEGHRVESCCITNDGKTIVACYMDQYLKVWDVESGNCRRTLVSDLSSESLKKCWLSNSERFIIASCKGDRDNTLAVWRLDTGEEQLTSFDGFKSTVTDCAFSSDDKFFVASSLDGSIIVFDFITGRTLKRSSAHGCHVYKCYLSSDDRFIVSCGERGCVLIHDIQDIRELTYDSEGYQKLLESNKKRYGIFGLDSPAL